MSNLSVNTITNAAGGNTAQINNMTPTGLSLQGFRNRLFNGNMVIDQRNNGASVTQTASNLYGVDRFQAVGSVTSKFTFQQSTNAPAGFTNSTLITSSAATAVGASELYVFGQLIEGLNMADLGWGTATAQAVTLSFWVRSSLTGTFGGSIQNHDNTRNYPLTYTISAANTWEYKTVTIAGDTTGTWLTTNGVGMRVRWSMGAGATVSGPAGAWSGTLYFSATGAVSVVGTNGATWQITGVQLEAGAVATPFERRPFGTEMALCQRYCFVMDSVNQGFAYFGTGVGTGTTTALVYHPFPVMMRANPTAAYSAANTFILQCSGGGVVVTVTTGNAFSNWGGTTQYTVASGCSTGSGAVVYANNTTAAKITYSAEL